MTRTIFISALVGAVAALLVGGTVALATNMTFILGSTTANKPDALTAVTAQNKDGHGGLNGPMIKLTNSSTGGSASPLSLVAGSGRPPFATNSSAKVANLNADKLDGFDAGAFVQGGGRILRVQQGVSAGDDLSLFQGPNYGPQVTYECPQDLSNGGAIAVGNPSPSTTIDIYYEIDGYGLSHKVLGHNESFSINPLNPDPHLYTWQLGWFDGTQWHMLHLVLYADERDNQPDPRDNGCYVQAIATAS